MLLTIEGFQLPAIPLFEIFGKIGGVSLLQIDVLKVNIGVTIGFTTILIIVLVAHCPLVGVGVKVYDPEVVLLTVAGFQVPTIPLFEVVNNIGDVAPLQIDAGKVNFGITFFITNTVNNNVFAH